MAVTFTKSVKTSLTTVKVLWSSDETPPVTFRVVREGVIVSTFLSENGKGEHTFTVIPGDAPFIEVLDRACQLPSIAFPGRVTLHWRTVSGAVKYRVEELVSAVWTLRKTVPDGGSAAFVTLTRWLEDTTSHQFRIIPVDAAGNQGTAIAFTFLMVRHPNRPATSIAYNGSVAKTITVSAA